MDTKPLLLAAALASPALAGCLSTQAVTTGTPRAPRPANCTLQVIPPDVAHAGGYDRVGMISMTAPVGTDPLDESIRARVQPKACALGGEYVSLVGAGGGLGPIAPQGIAFAVWAKKTPQTSKPIVWGAEPAASSAASAKAAPNAPPKEELTPATTPAAPPPPTLPPPPSPTSNADTSPPARAVDTRFALAASLGYASDDLNLGLGARGGKTLESRIYLGGTFVYHFGHSATASAAGYSAEASFSAFYLGPEAGYEFDLAPVIVRPYVGLGMAWLTVSASGPMGASASNTDTKFVIWPGATVEYDLPESAFFVGGDARFVSVPGGPSFGVFAFGGTRL